MEKPILATNIDDLLIAHEAFIEPHNAWFDRVIEKTGNQSLNNWKGKEDYFIGVNQAMEQLMPDSSPEERTTQARKWYQEEVIKYIQEHPQVIKKNIAEKLRDEKTKYRLALITTNTKDHINKIIKISGLEDIYDIIVASEIETEPKKSELIDKFIEEYGKPEYYLTGKQEPKIINHFNELGIKVIKAEQIDEI